MRAAETRALRPRVTWRDQVYRPKFLNGRDGQRIFLRSSTNTGQARVGRKVTTESLMPT